MFTCSSCDSNKKRSEEIVSHSYQLNLDDATKADLEKKASNGDPDAAFKMSNYYMLYLHDEKTGMYWLRKSASLGLTKAKYNLGILLYTNYDDPSGRDEGITWLKAAASDGDKQAIDFLKAESIK